MTGEDPRGPGEEGGTQQLRGRGRSPSRSSPRRMDFRTPDLLDVWLEPPEEVSAGAFLELGLPCPAPEVPGPKLREQGPGGWEPSGGRGCVSVRPAGGVGRATAARGVIWRPSP